MILVVGATGLLGSEICRRLRGAGHPVRALVRANSACDRISAVQSAGAALTIGDLKNPASLSQACEGVSAVITTASSTLSRQDGDSIETVDRQGEYRQACRKDKQRYHQKPAFRFKISETCQRQGRSQRPDPARRHEYA